MYMYHEKTKTNKAMPFGKVCELLTWYVKYFVPGLNLSVSLGSSSFL